MVDTYVQTIENCYVYTCHILYHVCIASVTIETVPIIPQTLMHEVLATDVILVKTWTLGQYDIL